MVLRNVLTSEELERFRADGYAIVKRAFDPNLAATISRAILDLLNEQGVQLDKPERARYEIDRQAGELFDGLVTDAVLGALDDLLLQDQWDRGHLTTHGAFFVTFPGFHGARWSPPFGVGRWHIDLGYESRDVFDIEDGNCAAVPVFLLTASRHGGACTVVVPGSHRTLARLLAKAGGRLPRYFVTAFCEALMSQQQSDFRVVELTGEAGDFVILHPHLVHAASANVTQSVRIMCNTGIGMKGRRQFRSNGKLSVVDEVIRDSVRDIPVRPFQQSVLKAALQANHSLWKARYRVHQGLPDLVDRRIGPGRMAAERGLRHAGFILGNAIRGTL